MKKKLETHLQYRQIIAVWSYYCVTFREYAFSILLSLALLPVGEIINNNGGNTNNTSSLPIAIGIILALIVIMKALFFAYFAETTVSSVQKSLARTRVSDIRRSTLIVKLALNVISVCFRAKRSLAQPTQAILVFVYIALELAEMVISKPFTSIKIAKISLVAQTAAFFAILFDIIAPDNADLLTLFVSPIVA